MSQPKQPLTAEEQRTYSTLFHQLDAEALGVVTGEAARSTFEKSGLPPVTLGEIWQLADPTNLGFLTQQSFCIALRLIGHVQQGAKPESSLIDYAGPLATFNGATAPVAAQKPQPTGTFQLNAAATGSPSITGALPLSTTGGPGAGHQPQLAALPLLTNHDISKFSQLFAKNAPSGVINGNQARSIFLKAKLPTNVLGQIWALADRNNAGQLTRDEFVIAMYLIQGSISGAIKNLPPSVPDTTWGQVKSFQSPVATGSTVSFSPQPTGARPVVSRVPSSFANASNDWVISPQKRAQFDSIFEGLDKNSTGVLGPSEVATFLMSSRLSQETLATVWDLADIHNTGEFTKNEFAIAMFLVQKKIAGAELPEVVPDSLLQQSHPALQQQNTLAFSQVAPLHSQPTQSTPDSRPQIPSRDTKPKSALSDLVDLNDAFSTPIATPTSESRNVSNATVNYTPTGSAAPKPFAPSSSFGQGLVKQHTASAVPAVAPAQSPTEPPVAPLTQALPAVPQSRDASQSSYTQPFPPPPQQVPSSTGSAFSSSTATGVGAIAGAAIAGTAYAARNFSTRNDDLLADSNPEVSGKLSQATTDMANLSNQIGSLSSQTSQIHEKRTRAEKELAKITALKQDIESKLTKLRAAYDQEVKQTSQVESLLVSSRQETEQLRQEASVAEAQYNQVQTQLQQLQSELQESQTENSSLKERLGNLNAEQIEINKELERVRGDVKQSKGLVAINSKQLNVAEIQASGIREEIENLLTSARELDTHHENYTKKQAELQVAHKQVADNESALLARQQQLEQADAELASKLQEHQVRVQQQQEYDQALQLEDQRLQQAYAELQERQRQHDAAEQQLQQQQVEYAQRIQQFTEKQIQDVTTGFDDLDESAADRETPADDAPSTSASKGVIAGALGVVGAAAFAAGSATSETDDKNDEFDSPVAATTEKTTSVTSDDQYPVAQQFDQLDIQRPESVTSSVQNNAPQSVRGDDIDETPNIDAITEEPALASDVLSKDYNPSSTRDVDANEQEAERESSGVGSFEIVDGHKSESDLTMGDASTAADSTIGNSADAIEQSIPGAWAEPSEKEISEDSPPVSGDVEESTETSKSVIPEAFAPADDDDDEFSGMTNAVEANDEFDSIVPAGDEAAPAVVSDETVQRAPQDEEFPPIKELAIDESDSDDDEFHETSESFSAIKGPSQSYDPSASPLVNAAAGLSAFPAPAASATTAAVERDAFVDDFDGLEEAAEASFQDDEDLESQQFTEGLEGTNFFGAEDTGAELPSASAAASASTRAPQQGDEEWEQLFAGFGNQPQQISQPQAFSATQTRAVEGSSAAVPPRIATTPRSLAVQELTGMGFSESEALNALEREKWNLEAATNYLLDHA